MLTFTTTRFTVTASHDLQAHPAVRVEHRERAGLHFPRITPEAVPIGQAQQDVITTSAPRVSRRGGHSNGVPTSAQSRSMLPERSRSSSTGLRLSLTTVQPV